MSVQKCFLAMLLLNICFVFHVKDAKSAQSQPAHSLQDLVKVIGVRDAKISPDGRHFSVVFRDHTQEKLAIFATATLKPISVFHVRGLRRSVGQVDWVNNERLVYSVQESYLNDKSLRDSGELFGANIDGTGHDVLFGDIAFEKPTTSRIKKKKPEKGNHKIIDLLANDDEHILISFYPWVLKGKFWRADNNLVPSVYKLNVYTGRKTLVTKLHLPGAHAITDNRGQVRFSVGINAHNRSVVSYREKQSDDWGDFVLKDFPANYAQPLAFSSDDKSVYLSATVAGGTSGLFRVNLADQSYVKEFHDPTVDMSQIIKDYQDQDIIIVGKELGLPSYQYLSPNDRKAKLHKTLVASFPTHDIRITSSTRDGHWSIVYAFSDTNSGDYYLFNAKEMAAQHLFSASSWLAPELMASMKPITVKTRDNQQIHGYLTLPNSGKKNLPLVVYPHGGPHGIRDRWGYDWEVQLLAKSGYAVLQINFRGSDGYGVGFQNAGSGKWGTLMQDDVTDATLAMIERGVANKDRICIYGASYGAYAALMGAVREPNLYKCTIGSMGVYDLPMMFEAGDITRRESGLAYLRDVLGNDLADQKQRSPVYNVNKIKATVLLIHGEKDERVPIAQAEALKDAFDNIGKEYQWLALNDEAHGYYDEENRLRIYRKILDFLQANIGE